MLELKSYLKLGFDEVAELFILDYFSYIFFE